MKNKKVNSYQAVISYLNSKRPWDYQTNLSRWLNKDLEFSKVKRVEFDQSMCLSIVEFDKDHCIYVLIPQEVFEGSQLIGDIYHEPMEGKK